MSFDVVFADRVAITEHLFGFKHGADLPRVTFRLASAPNKAADALMAA